MRNLIVIVLCAFSTGLLFSQSGLPSNPKPGSCYVSCVSADEYTTVEERIMVSPEYTKLEIVPATYKTVEERVLVKEATKRMTFVPATYETVTVSYVQKEGRTDLTIVPASFMDAAEVREIYPATTAWEFTNIVDCKSNKPGDCKVWCYVEKPSSSRTIATKKLAADATTNSTSVAEKTATYNKQVIKTPARMDETPVPEEYATIKKEVLDSPASTRKVTVPAEYTTITKTVLSKKGGITSYEEIDCKLVSYNALPIYYDLGSAALTAEAKKVIDDNLYNLLVSKPGIRVEIASHTDSRSNDSYNMTLSQRRAESVANYLVGKGISRNRLVAKGYGETKLVNRCANDVECSEAEHAQNRRTEFRVISE